MSFAWPVALLGLLALPVLIVAIVWRDRRRQASRAAFASPELLPNLVDRDPGKLRFLPLAVLLIALTAMIVGVARPQATVSVPREEATVVLAIDVSRSMKAADVEPTRLDAARAAAKAFVEELPEKFQVGVVSFATRAAVGVPPTEDRALVFDALDSLAPGEGTAIGDAVALSLELGMPPETTPGAEPAEEPPPRAILLISDGAQDGGIVEPAEAAEQARSQGVPVHAVLLGTPDGVVEETLQGGFTRVIRVPPSPETLQELTAATGGQLFTALDVEQLRVVHEELGSRLGTREELREISDVFAAGAAGFLALGGLLSVFLFRRVP
ncbi:MAG: VWA domain-containing protein [Gaiellaceae bacterium]